MTHQQDRAGGIGACKTGSTINAGLDQTFGHAAFHVDGCLVFGIKSSSGIAETAEWQAGRKTTEVKTIVD